MHFNSETLRQDPRYAYWAGRMGAAPSWVWKLAALAAALVIVVPIILLVLAAAAAFLLCFFVLWVIHTIAAAVSGLFGASTGPLDAGRRNVRVIRDEQT